MTIWRAFVKRIETETKLRIPIMAAVFRLFAMAIALAAIGSDPAFAHTSEQAFVLLLPTDLYIASGVSVVALTVVAVAVLPHEAARSVFSSLGLINLPRDNMQTATSLVSFAFLAALLYLGPTGTANPTENLLPLIIWTMWWMGFVIVQALFGDIWRLLNPWAGVYRVLSPLWGQRTFLSLPGWLGSWPGVTVFLFFGCFMLADVAPEDPTRLAAIVASYWAFTFVCMVLFGGDVWLGRGECFTMVLRRYASLAFLGRIGGQLKIGIPGWRLMRAKPASLSGAVLVLLILGTGSFDGLNETFWWLGKIGINPLEFPGRSAVIVPTILGLLIANVFLVAVFALVVWLGLALARSTVSFVDAFGLLALAILPIALGYHAGHYLTALLVQVQYTISALSDPFGTGADFLRLGQFYVTTGFFNSRDTVEIIWLCQAGAVVIGHVLSILLGHALATRLFATSRQAFISQLPLALFMIVYTLFGLWLLATPRGA